MSEAQRQSLQATLDGGSQEHHGGLGLVLANLVARAHGGTLSLPPVDQGFAVELQLGATGHV